VNDPPHNFMTYACEEEEIGQVITLPLDRTGTKCVEVKIGQFSRDFSMRIVVFYGIL